MLPALVTMSIAATRMYRTLARYGSQTHMYVILHIHVPYAYWSMI